MKLNCNDNIDHLSIIRENLLDQLKKNPNRVSDYI